jgi:hypothetical protein
MTLPKSESLISTAEFHERLNAKPVRKFTEDEFMARAHSYMTDDYDAATVQAVTFNAIGVEGGKVTVIGDGMFGLGLMPDEQR